MRPIETVALRLALLVLWLPCCGPADPPPAGTAALTSDLCSPGVGKELQVLAQSPPTAPGESPLWSISYPLALAGTRAAARTIRIDQDAIAKDPKDFLVTDLDGNPVERWSCLFSDYQHKMHLFTFGRDAFTLPSMPLAGSWVFMPAGQEVNAATATRQTVFLISFSCDADWPAQLP